MTLIEFLLARIAEDEAAARAASPGPWHLNTEGDEVIAVDELPVADTPPLKGGQQLTTASHIARHDPARVLAECEAKRRVVNDIIEADVADVRSDEAISKLGDAALRALQQLAVPYAHHPDYREEWRP